MFCFLWRRHQVSSSSASFPTFFYSKSSIWCFILETHCITLITMWACMRWDTLGYDYCWNSIMQTASPNPYFCISIIVIVTSWWKQLLHLSSAADLWWCVFTFMSWRSELSRHFLKKSFLFVELSSSRLTVIGTTVSELWQQRCDWLREYLIITTLADLYSPSLGPFACRAATQTWTKITGSHEDAHTVRATCHLTLVVALARLK